LLMFIALLALHARNGRRDVVLKAPILLSNETGDLADGRYALGRDAPEAPRATRAPMTHMRSRGYWSPIAAMMLLSFLSYVDRNTLAILSQTILRETGISAEQYGWMISAFSAAYLVGNPVWGRALDRFGLRVGLGVSVALWTIASVSHAFVATAVGFAIARAALGFGEGATFPAGLRTSTQTLRTDERGRGVAVAYSGASLGAIATPLVVTPIALRWGWRGAFLFTGALGAAWLVLWAWVSTDSRLAVRPSEHGDPRPRLGSLPIWGFMAAYALGGVPLGFVLYDAPIHLSRSLGCSQATLGHVLWIPPLGWEVGYFFWGWVIDRATKRGEARADRFFALLSLLALTLAAAAYVSSPAAVLALLFLAMFASAGFVIVSLTETTRRHSVEHGAYLAGLGAGSWSALMMIAMPMFGRMLDRADYRAAYAIAAVCPMIGGLGWRWLATTPTRYFDLPSRP
jgi:ACS family hexuronate transporter-like MFS transporter